MGKKRPTVGVVGLGYVGLPLSRTFFDAGFSVTGFDVDPAKITALDNGECYLKHLGTNMVAPMARSKNFTATADLGRLGEPDAIVICVPTPLGPAHGPDLKYVGDTATAISRTLRKGQLIVLESTTYPGTTTEVVKPILEKTGLKCEKDFFLAFSPEREDPGNATFSTGNIPKIVGGTGPKSLRAAKKLYAATGINVVEVSSCEVAEASKLLENIYRSVNIALVNELKLLFDKMNIDVWEVIRAASTKPFGFQPFYPGPGLGGHCIPIDPFYLAWKAKQYGFDAQFIELAGEINTAMPAHVVRRVTQALKENGRKLCGAKVLVLGVAYKKDVDDMRESPALPILKMLKQRKARVSYNDPHIPVLPKTRKYDFHMKSKDLTAKFLKEQDCVVIITDHTAYDYQKIVSNAKLVVDTRNATAKVKRGRSKIVTA